MRAHKQGIIVEPQRQTTYTTYGLGIEKQLFYATAIGEHSNVA